MTPEEVETVRRLVHGRSGVLVDPTKTYLIETRLAPVVRREGLASLSELIELVRTNREDRLIWAVADALISHETAFFRDRRPRSTSSATRFCRTWPHAAGRSTDPDLERRLVRHRRGALFTGHDRRRRARQAQWRADRAVRLGPVGAVSGKSPKRALHTIRSPARLADPVAGPPFRAERRSLGPVATGRIRQMVLLYALAAGSTCWPICRAWANSI